MGPERERLAVRAGDAGRGERAAERAADPRGAAVETGIALYDEARAAAAFVAYGVLEATAFTLQMAAEAADIGAQLAAQAAKGAARAADIAARLADAAARTAHVLAAVAAQEAAVAAHDDALVAKLTAAYAGQQARKLAKAARAVARAVKKAAKAVGHVAVAVAKAAYKYSGAQDVVSCVTNPHLSSCIKAAVTVALVVATAGEGEVEVAAMNAAEEGGADIAEQVGAKAAEGVGDATVQIFRNVSPEEFDSIASTGRFSTAEGQMEGKWFATQGNHAEQWGQKLNKGEGLTVETRIPKLVADQLHYESGKLDGIGPAYFADRQQLNLVNQTMNGIRAWP